MKTITITLNDDTKHIDLHLDPPTNFPDFLQIMLSVIGNAMHRQVEFAPPEDQQAVKDDVYGMFNVAAANVLDRFDPNPTQPFATQLTERAILEAENRIIERAYRSLPKDRKSKKAKQ